jgi:predicted HTH domain antitoxin
MHVTREVFEAQARFAMSAMLYHEGKLSSGQAAALAQMDRVAFLNELPRHSLSMSNLPDEKLLRDLHA